MSMLTAQCDKLRDRARELRQGRWSDGADDARLMEDAADTIDNLRGQLTERTCINVAEPPEEGFLPMPHLAKDKARSLKEENEKLRIFAEGAYYCELIDGCDTMCPLAKYNPDDTVDCLFSKLADELGLEPNDYGDEG